jgi:uncharacterized membrane protein
MTEALIVIKSGHAINFSYVSSQSLCVIIVMISCAKGYMLREKLNTGIEDEIHEGRELMIYKVFASLWVRSSFPRHQINFFH